MYTRLLNVDNKLYNKDKNKLVVPNRIDTSASNSRYKELESLNNTQELEKFILTAIEQRIRKNNILVASRIVKKASKKAQVFKEGWIVTVAIPSKLQQSVEPKRLLVRILGINQHSHTLISRFERIKGAFQAG